MGILTQKNAPKSLIFGALQIWIARRGGCSKTDILNTYDWQEIEKFKRHKQTAIHKAA